MWTENISKNSLFYEFLDGLRVYTFLSFKFWWRLNSVCKPKILIPKNRMLKSENELKKSRKIRLIANF